LLRSRPEASATALADHHALILAPQGRDAAIALGLAREAGVEGVVCADLPGLAAALGDRTCFVVVTEETLRGADLRALSAWIKGQPSWSDLPFIVLTQRGGGPERNPSAVRLLEVLGNVSFLERPFHPTTFVSLARSALQQRNRQFEARARIEELHDSQEKLRQANETLEQRVASRTAELEAAHAAALAEMRQREKAEEQLRQAQKMEAVGQLTGGVAHDFNNLLTILRSSIEFLKRPNLPAERRERYIQAISETTERAAKLTSQLLAFARRQPLKPEVFDIARRVEDVSAMVRPLMGSRVVVEVDLRRLAGRQIHVEADASQFETALVNLSVNARDAMDGEGRLTFEVVLVDAIPPIRGHAGAQGAFAAVSVIDTGVGIPPDRLEAIFEPFYTTKEVGKGTGLGLSQVFGFVKQSGGDIEVTSAPDQGSRFTIYLPAAPNPRPTVQPPPEVTPTFRPLRVLVVEDNDAVGQFATEMLTDLGHQIVWAGGGERALAVLDQGAAAFDVVFSDVIMPGMNGLDLAQAIRSRYPHLPVVLTSGYSNVLAQEGAHGFDLLRKPYSVQELAQSLAKAVQGEAPAA
jgi:signal transduction histidine kinase